MMSLGIITVMILGTGVESARFLEEIDVLAHLGTAHAYALFLHLSEMLN